jgi:hypothetical protein
MKALAKMSVLGLGVLIFLLLALAVYVFRTMPYLLGAVLIGEIIVLGAAILAPLLNGGAKKGWIGRAAFALVAVALANSYMLFLAARWNIEPQGWCRAVLHWQDGAIRFVLAMIAFVVAFLDAVLKAVFSLGRGPISAFLEQLHAPSRLELDGLPGVEGAPTLSLGLLGNMLLGVLGSLWTALVVKQVVSRAHGGAEGHADAKAHH